MMSSSAGIRIRALESEQRARIATDAAVKREWEELATQWHLLADILGLTYVKEPNIDVA